MPSTQIIEKNFPSDFSADILDIVDLMTLPNTFRIGLLGSSALKIAYPSDFDAYSEVNVTNTTTKEFQDVIKNMLVYRQGEFKQMNRQDKSVYIADIKCGIVERFRIVPEDITTKTWNSSLKMMVAKNKEMFKNKVIDKEDYDLGVRLLQPNLTYADVIIAKNELNYEVVRWRPHNIIKGFVIYRTEKVVLNEALYQQARVKIDCLSWVGGNRYAELSMVYKFYKDGKIIYDENYKLEDVLRGQVLVNNYNGNYMKMAKRMLSLERFKKKPDEMIIKQLFVLFNSDLGRLTQIISDIDNYIYMVENYADLKDSPLPIFRFKFESDQFKTRLSQIVNKSYLRHEMYINSLIVSLETSPVDVGILTKLRDELYRIVQENTLIYLKQNRLYPVARMFMPEEEPVLISRDKKSPEAESKKDGDILNGFVGAGVDASHLIKGKGKKYCMPVKELVTEHKRIVGELKTVPTLKPEYNIQKKELAKYQKMEGSGTPFKTAANKAGMTMHSFAEKHKDDKGLLGKRSRFFINVIENHLRRMKGGEIRADYLKLFFSSAYNPLKIIANYKLDQELSTDIAVVYYDAKKNHAVVSIRGTDGLRDHINNAIFALSGITGYKLTKRFKDAKVVFNAAVKKYGAKRISLLGYSQGSIAAVELGKDVFEMILFNPASKPFYNTVPNDNEYIVKGSTDPISNLNPLKKNNERTTIIKTDDLNLKKSHGIDILDRIGEIMIGKEFS